jgi:hypothetical protein
VAVLERYRNTGAPVWSESPVIDREGLAKLQEIMVAEGLLSPAKIIAYEAIVASDVALKAQQSLPPI